MADDSPPDQNWSAALRRRFSNLAGSDGADTPGPVHLPAGTVCELISNARRRAVIKRLSMIEDDEVTTLGELARRIAGEEYDIPPEQVSQNQRKSVYISLRQNHLPKLAETEIVVWDKRGGDISRDRSVDAIAALIGLIEDACTEPDPESA
jgi:hypothetical protein